MTRPQAESVVHIDDERFKVTEWRFAPGAETGWHVHGHDYVIVPLTDGVLGLDEPGGTRRTAALAQGVPYSRREGVSHNVTNAGPAPLAFLEIETVADAAARRRADTLARFMAAWNARDPDGLMSCMAPDCTVHAASGPDAEGSRFTGRLAVREAFLGLLDRFPKAEWTAVQHHVAGNTGVSVWRFAGTDRGGLQVEAQGCGVFSFEDDLVALLDAYTKRRD